MVKILQLQQLNIPHLISKAIALPATGRLEKSSEGYTYLNIDDRFIHDLYPLLPPHTNIIKPDYFNKYTMGAHITVVYPEEKTIIDPIHLGEEHTFTILGVYTGVIMPKQYFVLLVNAPSLTALRNKYKLGPKLSFKKHHIDLHITVGVIQRDH